MNSYPIVPLKPSVPLTDPAQIVALIEYTEAPEPAYTVHAADEALAYQILNHLAQPYQARFNFGDGELTGFGYKLFSPGHPNHFAKLPDRPERHQLLTPLGLTITYLPQNVPLPTFSVQVSRSFPQTTPG